MQPKPSYLTPAEYLGLEQKSPAKREYVDGEIYAMVGGTRRHNLIASTLVCRAGIAAAAHGRVCQVFGSDMKVYVETHNCFYYPDLSAVCDSDDRHELFLSRPCFIVEVLSPSTAIIDRREKRVAYLSLESLREYAIVNQDQMRVELYRREDAGWRGYLLDQPDDVMESSRLRMSLTLQEVYEGVDLRSGISEPEPPPYEYS
ncbi:MAG: Uma2 family endonuclease [Sinobacteraceae bacterium]|nr:Uma2 family endonuclease [Nevskiaceae bacterium]